MSRRQRETGVLIVSTVRQSRAVAANRRGCTDPSLPARSSRRPHRSHRSVAEGLSQSSLETQRHTTHSSNLYGHQLAPSPPQPPPSQEMCVSILCICSPLHLPRHPLCPYSVGGSPTQVDEHAHNSLPRCYTTRTPLYAPCDKIWCDKILMPRILNSDAAKRTASHFITRYVLIAPRWPCRSSRSLAVCLKSCASNRVPQ